MFFHEKTYDIDELMRHNMHIHTTFSGCAKPEMTAVNIVETAEKCGLEIIALTDHNYFPDRKNAVAVQRLELLRQLEEIDYNIKVYVGAELSAYGPGKFADDIE